MNTIDLHSACDRGIYVANCPGKNTAAVAELAIGLLIAADRRICDATLTLRNGQWKKKEFGTDRGLKGRTLGIMGFGNIGRAVATRALGLGMKVIAWSRSLTEETAHEHGVEPVDSPVELSDDLRARVLVDGKHPSFLLASLTESGLDRAIVVTQADFRELQLASGAIRAGIELLLRRAEHVDLSCDPEFQMAFADAMLFPSE